MRSPTRPIPDAITWWSRAARALRALDGVLAWLVVWVALALWLDRLHPADTALVAVLVTGAGALLRPLRARVRPASALAAILLSARLRPGDRAWLVGPDRAELVLVTGRRRLRLVIVFGAGGPSEGILVRRTRGLLVPADRRAAA